MKSSYTKTLKHREDQGDVSFDGEKGSFLLWHEHLQSYWRITEELITIESIDTGQRELGSLRKSLGYIDDSKGCTLILAKPERKLPWLEINESKKMIKKSLQFYAVLEGFNHFIFEMYTSKNPLKRQHVLHLLIEQRYLGEDAQLRELMHILDQFYFHLIENQTFCLYFPNWLGEPKELFDGLAKSIESRFHYNFEKLVGGNLKDIEPIGIHFNGITRVISK